MTSGVIRVIGSDSLYPSSAFLGSDEGHTKRTAKFAASLENETYSELLAPQRGL
jgi:hypothetical protein